MAPPGGMQIGCRPDLPPDLHQLRPKAANVTLEDLLVSVSGEDEEAMCLRALVGVFYACTHADNALRPKASEIAAILEKVEKMVAVEGKLERGVLERDDRDAGVAKAEEKTSETYQSENEEPLTDPKRGGKVAESSLKTNDTNI